MSYAFYVYKVNSLRRHKEQLENLVRQRTCEIEEKNARLVEQTQVLNSANSLLEERQQYIENQARELLLNSENLKQVNELLIEKQKMVLSQAENLKETNQKLIILNATKDKFFSIIAHDLKNPFNSLLGFSELLNTDFRYLAEEKKMQIIELIHVSAQRIYKLLENLLQWAGTQTGNLTYNPEVFNLKELIQSNYDLVKEIMTEKNDIFIKNLPDDSVVFADRNMINTIIRNLLGNAIKFTENGEISITVKTRNSYQEITVSDTGLGIPEDKLNTIFEIDRVRSTGGTRGEQGSGLGLLICKEFVERNKGEIWVKDNAGKGTSFIFTIPRSL